MVLHTVGSIRHNNYLAAWGLDADLFPKSLDWMLIHGFYGVFNRLSWLFSFAWNNLGRFLLAVAALVAYFFLLSTPGPEGDGLRRWLQASKAWVRRLIKVALFTFIGSMSALLAMLLIYLAIVLLGALGESAGLAGAEQSKLEFRKGCAASKPRCVTLLRDDKPIAHGYLLDSSPEHIALFDVDLKQARAIPRDGLELRSDPERTALATSAASAASQP